jgi:hypothetical protein
MYADIHSAAFAPIPQSAAAPRDASATGTWPELLSDLGCLGRVWIETESPALTLAHRETLSGLRVQDAIGHVQGEGFALRLLLGRCDALRAAGPPSGSPAPLGESLLIEDARGRPLVALRPAPRQDTTGFVLRTLLRAHGVNGRRLRPRPQRPAPQQPVPLRALQAVVGHAAVVQRDVHLDDGIGLMDQAELSGLLALHPRRLRERGSAVGVDPDLVPCALEALADHAVPISVITGNAGCVRRVDAAPFAARRAYGWCYLRGDDLTLRLDTTRLDSAWVIRRGDHPAAPPELRLYDDDGRAIAVLRSLPTAGGGEHSVWATLIDALLH